MKSLSGAETSISFFYVFFVPKATFKDILFFFCFVFLDNHNATHLQLLPSMDPNDIVIDRSYCTSIQRS